MGFCQLFEQFSSLVPRINDTCDKHRPYISNRDFYSPWQDPIIVDSTEHICYYMIKSLRALSYLEDKFVFDNKFLFEHLTAMDPNLYMYIKGKINDNQHIFEHIDQLFLIKDSAFRNNELMTLGITIQDICERFRDYQERFPLNEKTPTSELSVRSKLIYNLIVVDDDETMIVLIHYLPINVYYWIMCQCVKSNSVKILKLVDTNLMIKLVEQYGLILPDDFHPTINQIISKITNTDIFNYMYGQHKEAINIETYNTLMYEWHTLIIWRFLKLFLNLEIIGEIAGMRQHDVQTNLLFNTYYI